MYGITCTCVSAFLVDKTGKDDVIGVIETASQSLVVEGTCKCMHVYFMYTGFFM